MTTIFNTGSWISSVWDAGNTATQSAGMMGALQTASSKNLQPGSLKAFLNNNQSAAAALSTVAQTSVTNRTALVIQQADAAVQKLAAERAALANKGNIPMIPKTPVGDRFFYFDNGSTLDTEENILTMADGKKINTLTGADYVDPKSLVNLANGSYLDTANNILTMADGTKIDTLTGLII